MTEMVKVVERASLYLMFFQTAPDEKSRSCKLCNQSYPIRTAYGNLGRHLKYRHPGYDQMGDAISNSLPQPITAASERADKMGVAIPSLLPQPITTITESAEKMDDAIPSLSPQLTTSITKTANTMGDAIPSLLPQPITTITESAEKMDDAVPSLSPQLTTSITKTANTTNMEPQNMMEVTIDEPENVGLGLSEEGKGTPVEKSSNISVVSFFEETPDGKSRNCKFCNQSYSIATIPDNLQKHLTRYHPGYENGTMDAVFSNPPPELIATALKSSTVDVDFNWLLLRWLIGESLPPSTLRDKWLSDSFKFINNSAVRFWSTERFQSVILHGFKSMQEDVKASLELVNSKISLTLDFWTSNEKIFYMSVTGHWIDETWCLHKVLLDISRIPYPCAGSDMYHTIAKVLKMYSIGNKILSCTHDNSQKAIHACHTLKEYLDGRNSTTFCHIPCAARTLNLIIEDGLRNAKPVISKIREFVLEMKTSLEISSDFKQATSAYREGSWEFPIDISTRWSGNYAMLEMAHRASKSMDAVIRNHEESLASSSMLMNPSEKVAVSIMHQYLAPFHQITSSMCTTKNPAVGVVLSLMDDVVKMVDSFMDSCDTPDWLKTGAEDMAKKGRSYNNQVHNICTYIAAILDPRIKGEFIPDNLDSEDYLEEARKYFLKNYTNALCPTQAEGYSARDMTIYTDELSQYLSEPPSPTTDVLDWWKENSSRYPKLSVMARDFLVIQPTSVSPSKVFSGIGDEIHKRRVCLPYASTQPVLCLREWIESGFKLKYRLEEVDFEQFMVSGNGTASTSALS
ncbi:hypothetical protein MKW92_027581 [Papaver armeniacum]|nr:hypothetical protein MKW92_027581 [Papaver armeniacum]